MCSPLAKHRLLTVVPVVLLVTMLLSVGCLGKSPQAASRTAVKAESVSPKNSNSSSVGVAEIPDISGFRQVVALSDVHGMFENVTHLLAACKIITPDGHWLADRTLLIVTGDSIDKGAKPLEVIDLWRTLTTEAPLKGSRVVVLLGNHEAEFLAHPDEEKSAATRDELKAQGLDVSDLVDSAHPRARFLRSLPLAARVGKRWLFCHAGWIPDMPYSEFVAKAQAVLRAGDYSNPLLLAPDSILEKKTDEDGDKWWKNKSEVKELKSRLAQAGLYGVVFGHQPTAFGLEGTVGTDDTKDARLIKIDSGMAPEAGGHPGHLLLFTAPEELTHDKRPGHIFSAGFEAGSAQIRTLPI